MKIAMWNVVVLRSFVNNEEIRTTNWFTSEDAARHFAKYVSKQSTGGRDRVITVGCAELSEQEFEEVYNHHTVTEPFDRQFYAAEAEGMERFAAEEFIESHGLTIDDPTDIGELALLLKVFFEQGKKHGIMQGLKQAETLLSNHIKAQI